MKQLRLVASIESIQPLCRANDLEAYPVYDFIEDGKHCLEITRGEDRVEGLALPSMAFAYGTQQTRAEQ